MNKKRKILGVILIVFLILIGTTNSMAAESFNISMKTESTTIKKEQKEVVINLVLDKYEPEYEDLLGYQADLVYDKDVFESATVQFLNDWGKQATDGYNTETGRIIATTTNPVVNKEIATITLKLKNGVTEEETKVEIKNMVITDSEASSTIEQAITYTFEKEEVPSNPPTTPEEDKTNPPTTPEDEGNKTPTTPSEDGNNKPDTGKDDIKVEIATDNDKTTADGKIPQTGVSMEIAICILVTLIILVFSLVRYKSIKLK